MLDINAKYLLTLHQLRSLYLISSKQKKTNVFSLKFILLIFQMYFIRNLVALIFILFREAYTKGCSAKRSSHSVLLRDPVNLSFFLFLFITKFLLGAWEVKCLDFYFSYLIIYVQSSHLGLAMENRKGRGKERIDLDFGSSFFCA